MATFQPSKVIIRENALDYPLGKKLNTIFSKKNNVEVFNISSRGPFPLNYDIPFKEKFHRAKDIIVVSVRSTNKFQTCKPSAHYQLPLVSGCPGRCHYCYLSTNLGKNPYVKVYVNTQEIYQKAEEYINERKPEKTIFEGAATSDPLPVEKWTGTLANTIEFFGQKKKAKFRFVTKYDEVTPLLKLKHNKNTEFRFSLNSQNIIKKYEPGTPALQNRINAASRVYKSGYPTGFLIAPLFEYENWKQDYKALIELLAKNIDSKGNDIFFELITHRFTERAKNIIQKAYPKNKLPMNEDKRRFKYGQFGYGKYVYPKKTMDTIKSYISKTIKTHFPKTTIKYFV